MYCYSLIRKLLMCSRCCYFSMLRVILVVRDFCINTELLCLSVVLPVSL